MIHTAQLLIIIQPKHIRIRTLRHGNPADEHEAINEIIYSSKIEGITEKEYFSDTLNEWICSLIVDIPKILNRGDVNENDYEVIKQFLEDLLGEIYGDSTLFEGHNLIRIDFRIDKEVPDLNLHYLYLELYRKTREKYSRLIKNPHEDFKTSIYHKCNSIETIFYSKPLEAISKNRKLDCWEVNMMRFEIRLKNSHLYYHCRKNNLEKKLITFFKKDKFDFYLENYLYKIFPLGSFYTFEKAQKLIHHSSCTDTLKVRLKHFVTKVSNGALDTPKIKSYPDHISKQTWQKRINLFNELDINPITIPIKYDIETLSNLLKDL